MDKDHRDKIILGVLKDTRTDTEKENDLHFHQLYSVAPIVWIEKPQSAWKHYTLRNQDGAGSCCGHGTAKTLEANDKVVYSAHPIYSRRSNKPTPGMTLNDVSLIMQNFGVTTEALDPSNNLNEQQMNSLVTVPTPKKVMQGVFVDVTNLDKLANCIEMYGGVDITVNVAWEEWNTEQGIPKYIPGTVIAGGHCISGVEYILYKGEKAIVAENSWGNDADSINHSGQLILTESFLRKRGTGAMFFIPNLPPPPTPVLPTVTLTRRLDDGTETLGDLSYGNFKAKTLELPWRLNQQMVSCIPRGTYLCKMNFSLKFMKSHYLLQNVPGRTAIYIHGGNFFFNTLGCLLVGDSYSDINNDKHTDVLNSQKTLALFEKTMGGLPFNLVIN